MTNAALTILPDGAPLQKAAVEQFIALAAEAIAARFLESLGAKVAIRHKPDGSQFVTDQGNMILDCVFGPIANALASSSTACSSA